jgi:hypothetical protein
LDAPKIKVEVRAYRAIGDRTDDLYNSTTPFAWNITPIDLGHPYLRWTHDVGVPSVDKEADGSLTLVGASVITRRSRIHLTDPSRRCLFAARLPTGLTAPTIEYLDTLPFAHDQLARHRDDVCDYCFFGGPDKHQAIA